MRRGRYFALEGPSRSGKTTQRQNMVDYWPEIFPGREVICTREPGAFPGQSEIADLIRNLVQGEIAQSFSEPMHPITEACLYAASRAQTLNSVVLPALERGCDVIADRSVISSLAFQGMGRGLGIDYVYHINWNATRKFSGYIRQRNDWFDYDTQIAKKICQLFIEDTVFIDKLHDTTIAYLYAACHAQTFKQFLMPETVVSPDGFQPVLPDLVIYLDIPPEEMSKRELDIKGDKFEGLDVDFHRKVRSAYRSIGQSGMFPNWIEVQGFIPGLEKEESIQSVTGAIQNSLRSYIAEWSESEVITQP